MAGEFSMEKIQEALDRIRGAWIRARLAEGSLVIAAIALAWVIIFFGLDNTFGLPAWLRIASLVVLAGGVVAAFVAKIAAPLAREPDEEALAVMLERRFPDLEDRAINAIQLARTAPRRRFPLVRMIIRDADAFLGGARLRRLLPLARVRRWAIGAGALLLAVLAYRFVLPHHFENAFARFRSPGEAIAPIGGTAIRVEPGDIAVPRGGGFAVRAIPLGRLPGGARVRIGDETEFPMTFDGRLFVFSFRDIQEPFRYAVDAGGARSRSFEVRVIEPPELVRIGVRIEPPAYTGLPSRDEDPSTGDVRALAGSTVTLRAVASKPLRSAALVFEAAGRIALSIGEDGAIGGSFAVATSDRYTFALEDEDGNAGGGARARTVVAIPDAPPAVELIRPEKDVSLAAAAPIAVAVRASDDVGLEEVSAVVSIGDEAHGKPFARWDALGGRTRFDALASLDIAGLGLAPGGIAFVRAEASDRKGQRVVSGSRAVRLLEPEEAAEKLLAGLRSAMGGLRQVLDLERALRADTALPDADPRRLSSTQGEIVNLSLSVLEAWEEGLLASMRGAFLRIVRVDMAGVIDALDGAAGEDRPVRMAAAIAGEDRIIAALESMLADLEGIAQRLEAGDADALAKAERSRGEARKLQELAEDVARFVEEQKEVIAKSEVLRGARVDDFTGAEKEALEELAALEETWAGVLRDLHAEYDKLTPQDFADATLAEEFLEAAGEVDLAANALEQKKVELAVPHEQSGLELAEEITANLERWLADVPDALKWAMEEPTGDFDVPIADLPSELEDLVGDLIDRESEMTEEVEDITSAWMDSLNEGAGWTAMDGPISNMSAKGVTGNLLPNDMEIAGRSGEGRSGRSMGQMVEESASGKGGRPTPTRATPDAFEAGEVKDTGKDPTGGATGGGKLSGAGEQGLRGAPSPELRRRMKGAASMQARVRHQAERVDRKIGQRYAADDLRRAIARMREMEEDLRAGRPKNYIVERETIEADLGAFRRDLGEVLARELDPTAALPPALRDRIRNARGEEAPEEYRDLVREYWRALAEQ
ncbi:MAG: hypothetical protein JXP34_18530 [Planctomycetes bacterium]|nr:hypothetical protein [Planctomycetota bacterium]